MAAKRSPILGYNHNVRYRGLIFHVQTEDSGVMSPHLFTHLFHEGVIVSTRKLVYDAGAAEDAIKSLMQAQHKAVLKDLKRGQFDDKIDQYLGGTPGLLPRGASGDDDRPSTPVIPALDTAPAVAAPVEAPSSEPTPPPAIGAPTIADLRGPLTGAETIADLRPPVIGPATLAALEQAESGDDDDEREPTNPSVSAILAAVTLREPEPELTPPPPMDDPPTLLERDPIAVPRTATDSTPEISIEVGADDELSGPASTGRRPSRDTEIQAFDPSRTVDTEEERARLAKPSGVRPRASDSVPPLSAPSDKRIGAASLPPMRQPTRPPSRPIVPLVVPPVAARPPTRDDPRREEADAAEVYSPPPNPAHDLGPGERPGQYSLRRSQKMAAVAPPPEPVRPPTRPAPAIPSGLARPGSAPVRARSASERPPSVPRPEVRDPRADTGAPPTRPRPYAPLQGEPARPSAPPRAGTGDRSRPLPAVAPERPRTTTPAQVAGRTPTPARVVPPSSRTGSGNAGGVVMTRPAVIVGAPAKAPASRVRKASEDSRGFGQGLISEKSLDEVILAYLSEDAEEK